MNHSSETTKPAEGYWVHKWKYEPMPLEIAFAVSAIGAVLGIFGAVTNGLVMFLVRQMTKFQSLQNMQDIFVMSLCFADFLSSVVVMPQVTCRILPRSQVSANQSLSLHISVHFTFLVGALSLLFLTINRYLSVKFPYFYVSRVTETKIHACLATIYAIAVAMVIWIFHDGESESRAFPVVVSLIVFLTMFFQVMLFAIIYKKSRNMRRQILAVEHNTSEISQMRRRTDVQRGKANRTILYICAVYIAAWFPAISFRIYYTIHGNLTLYIQWVHLFNVIIQLHSCINPFIYVLRTSRVKQILMRMFPRW